MGFGRNPPEVKRVSGKNSREFCLCVCVCDGLHLPRKNKGKVKILHLPPKKNTQVLHPATKLDSNISYAYILLLAQNGKMAKGKTSATGKQH